MRRQMKITYLKKVLLPLVLLNATIVCASETNKNPVAIDLAWLYLKPMSNNYTYAYYVAGTQPYYQNWHAQVVNPGYTSAFELGLRYAIKENQLTLFIDWLHLQSSD